MNNLIQVSLSDTNHNIYQKYYSNFETELFHNSALLKSYSIAHLSATKDRGGVAEIIKGMVPFVRSLGVDMNWYVLPESSKFFYVSRQFRDMFQGRIQSIDKTIMEYYCSTQKAFASDINNSKHNIWIVHDYQPFCAIPYVQDKSKKFIWHFHLDCRWSRINHGFTELLNEKLAYFHRYIFSAHEFVPPFIETKKTSIIAPAIDPFNPKNIKIDPSVIQNQIKQYGINPNDPLVVQIDRFNPYKDQIGLLHAYELARQRIPKLQIVFVADQVNKKDIEGYQIYQELKKRTLNDKQVFIIKEAGDNWNQVQLFQSPADIIVQKATRQGFGLALTEGMWKAKVVIGGDSPGVRMQIKNGINGFIVQSEEECAAMIVKLFQNTDLRNKIGQKAYQSVKNEFLLPRLVNDYLKMIVRTI